MGSSNEMEQVDMIDRQAAIDALTHKWDGMVTSVFDVVNSLPSAQSEIIRCKDCLIHGICRLEQWLGLDGYCSRAERRVYDEDR